jgi:Dyp-type peroxidase family
VSRPDLRPADPVDPSPGDAELADIQGNILDPYRMRHATHLLVGFESTASARDCLRRTVDRVTTAAPSKDRRPSALNVGITFSGLRRLGVPGSLLDQFPDAFRQTTRDRAEALGDVGASAPCHWDEPMGRGVVHLKVSVHGVTPSALEGESDWAASAIRESGGSVLREERTQALIGMAEHFGYADGLAQPVVAGGPASAMAKVRGGGLPMPDGRWRPLRLGEFVLGYPDEDDQVDLCPTADLVRNASYLVFRKLRQDVRAFRARLETAAEESGMSVEMVAAKVLGRWRDGVPIELAPHRSPTEDLRYRRVSRPSNDFRYLPQDEDGSACPRGAHIRRVNPRDAVDFDGTIRDPGRLTSRHRIIRRGMPYGPPYEDDPDSERGLIFQCFQADIARQFETIQATWCLDGDAFGLGDQQDFLLANERSPGTMQIPRRDCGPRFVTTQPNLVVTGGSEYFLVPGVRALHRLAEGGFARGHWPPRSR